MKLMLIDDHELFVKSLETALSSQVEEFLTFNCPKKLQAALARELPDILLMDIKIGCVNGLELGQKLLARYPALKVVYLTGYDLQDFKGLARNMGAKGFVCKTRSPAEFLQCLTIVQEGGSLFPADTSLPDPLTRRERQVLQQMSCSFNQQEAANALGISRRTLNCHLQSIFQKLEARSTIEALMKAIQLGIIIP